MVILRNLSLDSGLVATELARMTFNPSTASTSSNNLLAYRPNFADHHTSGLAAIFVNIQGIFPCLSGRSSAPICKMFTYEGDGFRNGHAIIESADTSDDFGDVFGNNIPTFAFALSGCPTMSDDCFPNSAWGVQYCMSASKKLVPLTNGIITTPICTYNNFFDSTKPLAT